TARISTDANARIPASKTTAIVNAVIFWQKTAYEMPTANTSSPTLRNQLLNGSGLVFAAARVPALVRCVVIATEPPSRATIVVTAGEASPSAVTATSAPPIGRTMVCTVSQTESTHGILSATNSIRYIVSAAPMTSGWSNARNWSGRVTRP